MKIKVIEKSYQEVLKEPAKKIISQLKLIIYLDIY